MENHSNTEYLSVTSETYQEIARLAAHEPLWSQYFLLMNACLENLKHMPATTEQRDQADIENLLIESLARLADAMAILMPGGLNEFRSYLKNATRSYKLPIPQIKHNSSPLLPIDSRTNSQ